MTETLGMGLTAFLAVGSVHLLAAISPGPTFVLTVRTAVAQGFAPAIGLALGYGIGAAIWATAALAGLTLLFEVAPFLFTTLKIVGGLYLIWLAVWLWRAAPEPMPHLGAGAAPATLRASIRTGLLAFMANPKPAVFFGAVFIGFVPPEASALAKAIIVANIFWVETLWYVIVARIFSLPSARAVYARAKTWLDRAFATALGALGARIALT
ncbi:MAG: LysE family transporter [Pseudomonadota bacterium]